MGMLAPWFLIGLLAVAVPVLVHLVQRERKEPLAFPSLMFLRRVPFRSARRQRIRYWLLFLLRTAALLLVALAFTRPWLERATVMAGAGAGGKDVVILIDRSYSMSAADRWRRAQQAARSLVAETDARDRVAVAAFGEQAELLTKLDDGRERAQAALATLASTADVTRYAPAFKLAGSVLAQSRGPAEIVVVTDRQRSGWRNLEPVDVPANTVVRVIDVSTPAARNVAVTDVRVAHSTFARRQRIVPTARIINRGDAEVTVPVELRIDDRVQQERTITVRARSSAEVRFGAMFATNAAGSVNIGSSDDIVADDVAYFTIGTTDAPVVRLISGSSDAQFYFERALSAGAGDAFAVHRTGARLVPTELPATEVVVFIETPLPDGNAGRQLEAFVRQGGGLIILAGEQRGEHALLPVRNIRTTERAAAVVSIDDAHPVFDPFRASGASQFASVHITRYLRSEPVPNATVLARFDDGAPALVEQRFGRGRVLYWASGVTRTAGDLVLQPVFVPFVQQLVRHAAAAAHVPRALVVGNVIDVNAFAPRDRDAIVLTPSRERIRLSSAAGARPLRIAEPGIYRLRSASAGGETQLIAANVDVSESDLATMPVATFQDATATRTDAAVLAAAALPAADRERRQSLWWYLLLGAFAMLAIETLLANRISSAWRK